MMRLEDIMLTDVYTIGPDDPIAVAAQKMGDHNVSCLVVVRGSSVLGIITDRDLALGCLIDGHDSWECQVFRHMSIQNDVASPEMDVSDTAILMMDSGISILPVARGGQLLGLVYSSDITRAIDHEMTLSSMIGAA